MSARLVIAGGLLVALTLAPAGEAQVGQGSQTQRQAGQPVQQGPPPMDSVTLGADEAAAYGTARMAVEQEKARNIERQKQLVADTDKLLLLANELKVDVDKTNKDTLSLDVIKKADEIEKLAHSVKEKMKGS